MTVIDMSEARANLPKPLDAVAVDQVPLLRQLFSIINNTVPASVGPAQLSAIEAFQLQGMLVALEYVANQTGNEKHPAVVELRTQIVRDQIRHVQEADVAWRDARIDADDR